MNYGYTRSISCQFEFAFISFHLSTQLLKSDRFSSELVTILEKCIFLAAATSCPIQVKKFTFFFFLPSNAHYKRSRLFEQLFERPVWLTGNLVLVIILFNSNNWSIDLFGIVTRKVAPRTIGRWCENIKIIVDFGAFDPSGWLEYTCYLIRFHMKMLHSSTKTTTRLWAGDRMNAPKILWKNLALLKLWRIPITCCMGHVPAVLNKFVLIIVVFLLHRPH